MFDHALFMLPSSIILIDNQGIPGYIVTAVRPFTQVSRFYTVNRLLPLTLDCTIRK